MFNVIEVLNCTIPVPLQKPTRNVFEPVISIIDSCHPEEVLATPNSEAITPLPVGKIQATTDIEVFVNLDAQLFVIAYWLEPLNAKYFPPVLEYVGVLYNVALIDDLISVKTVPEEYEETS